jgi:hypothetical protein
MELDDDARALLANLDPIDPAGGASDDDEVLWSPAGEGEPGDGAPKPEYVSKADYDRLQQQLLDTQRQIGELAGRQQFEQNAPRSQDQFTPGQGGAAPAFDRQKFNETFFADPSAILGNLFTLATQQAQRQSAPQSETTNAILARTIVNNLRSQYATENPELAKTALPEMDKIVASLSNAELARMVASNTLEVEYRNAYHRVVGEKLAPVYRTAAQRRAAASATQAPPPIGGGSVTPMSDRQKPIRRSDLTSDEIEALEQGKRFGITVEDILKQREYDDVPARRGAI